MNGFLLAVLTGLFLLTSSACQPEYATLTEDVSTVAMPPISTSTLPPDIFAPSSSPTATITPSLTSTSTSTPVITPTLSLIPPTSTSSPSPIPSPAPKPRNLSVALSESEHIRFINANTIAYLQWGTIYTHNLSTQQTGLLAGSGDIGSFDWSNSQQQFTIVQNGRLYLLDENGTPIKNLSIVLPPIHLNPRFIKACSWNAMTENDNLLDYIKSVRWNPEQPNIILGAANIDDYITHHCGPKIWSVNTQSNTINEIGWFAGYAPKPQWLNKDLLLLD